LEDFDIKRETGSFFKTRERETILKPEGFTINEPTVDEINDSGKNRYKIMLSFTLPKGSYATIVTKRIFGH
jgi:tRNA pseudouridine13 synthase